MNKLLGIFLCFSTILSAQKIKIETIFQDKISIRAIEIWDNKVWYVGTDSKFGYVDFKNPTQQKQWKLSDKKLQFRTLAQTQKDFFAINVESPAYFFKIDKKTLQHNIVYTDSLKTAFYDALHFIISDFGMALGDPSGNCAQIVSTNNAGKTWQKGNCEQLPKFHEGEAAFAASNTNIASQGKYIWIATGGVKSRILRRDFFRNWEAFETPFVQGTASTGIYSIDFYDENNGIAVGGDYKNQTNNINNIATTNDAGKTWTIQANGKHSGYKTCVKYRPKSKGKEIIALGDQDISYSPDYGKTWKVISNEKNLYTFKWVNKKTLVAAGKDKIVKISFE